MESRRPPREYHKLGFKCSLLLSQANAIGRRTAFSRQEWLDCTSLQACKGVSAKFAFLAGKSCRPKVAVVLSQAIAQVL